MVINSCCSYCFQVCRLKCATLVNSCLFLYRFEDCCFAECPAGFFGGCSWRLLAARGCSWLMAASAPGSFRLLLFYAARGGSGMLVADPSCFLHLLLDVLHMPAPGSFFLILFAFGFSVPGCFRPLVADPCCGLPCLAAPGCSWLQLATAGC